MRKAVALVLTVLALTAAFTSTATAADDSAFSAVANGVACCKL